MGKQKIIIIGAVAAGSKCAFKLKREQPNFDVIIYTDEEVVSYSACGLPFFIGGQIKEKEKLIVRNPEDYKKAGINLYLNHSFVSVNPKNKTVRIHDKINNKFFEDNYDKLVLATGARPFVPKVKGAELLNIFTLRRVKDGVAIKEQMSKSNTVLIVGGGYIGIELLESFIRNGLNVKMIEFSNHIMNLFDTEISEKIENHILEQAGDKLEIIKKDQIVEFKGENGMVTKAITSLGRELDIDMAIICTGVLPNTEHLEGSGIELGVKRTIKVDEKMRTNFPDIYAAGDCVEKNHIVTGKPCWIPLGSTANKEGRCCAVNIAGKEDETFEGVLGSMVARYFGFTMSMTGLTEREALRNGYKVVSETVTKKDKAGYMPEVKNVTIKVVVDKTSQRILGAQAIGCGDADKRVNAVAAALVCGKKLDDFVNLDMTYAPPFSPSIDPLLTAFLNLKQKLDS